MRPLKPKLGVLSCISILKCCLVFIPSFQTQERIACLFSHAKFILVVIFNFLLEKQSWWWNSLGKLFTSHVGPISFQVQGEIFSIVSFGKTHPKLFGHGHHFGMGPLLLSTHWAIYSSKKNLMLIRRSQWVKKRLWLGRINTSHDTQETQCQPHWNLKELLLYGVPIFFYLTFCSHDIILANNSKFELWSLQPVHLSRIELPPYFKWNGKLFNMPTSYKRCTLVYT